MERRLGDIEATWQAKVDHLLDKHKQELEVAAMRLLEADEALRGHESINIEFQVCIIKKVVCC